MINNIDPLALYIYANKYIQYTQNRTQNEMSIITIYNKAVRYF